MGFFFRFLSPDKNYLFLNLFLLLFELFMFAKLEVLINPVLKCWQEIMKIDISTIEPESTYNKFLQKWHDIINLYKSHHARGQYVWICLCVCFVECVCVCLCKQGCFIFDLYFILFLFWWFNSSLCFPNLVLSDFFLLFTADTTHYSYRGSLHFQWLRNWYFFWKQRFQNWHYKKCY